MLESKKLPDDEGWGRGKRPVINVNWKEAKAYAGWLTGQHGDDLVCGLPSEAEWEFAARAGRTDKAYWWGDEASHEYANYGTEECCGGLVQGADQWLNTAPVGSFPENPFGLHDMHGNVWEWTEDCWHGDYNNAPDDGSAWLEADRGDCDLRVLRGGSWVTTPDGLRSALRGRLGPDNRFFNFGFRVVCRPPS